MEVGGSATIYSSVRLAVTMRIVIGRETFIGSRTTFTGGASSTISIGNYCDVSDNVHFVTGTHEIDPIGHRTAGAGYAKDISIGDGVWIGYGALILPGVVIGDKAMIAAGTLVHKDVPAGVLVAGNPMRQIKKL